MLNKYKNLLLGSSLFILASVLGVFFSADAASALSVNYQRSGDTVTVERDAFGRDYNFYEAVTFTSYQGSSTVFQSSSVSWMYNLHPCRANHLVINISGSSGTGVVTAKYDTASQNDELCTSGIPLDDGTTSPDDLANPGDSTGGVGGGDTTEPEETCNIDGIGWLICPVVSFVGWITDGLYEQLEKHFLRTEPLSTQTDSPTYSVWSQVRNIANIAFILAFMVIVFSHISSIGLNNYNIKKMLPRLIIAAILVNVSYWICALAIDVSNIIGYHSKNIFTEVIHIENPDEDNILNSRTFFGDIVTGVITTAALVIAHLSILLPVLVAAAAALVTVVAVLLLREALIILLVVIAPLAFVAFLLPNTEGLFSKWRKLLMVLLMMYPAIGAIFGASQLASSIVMISSDETLTKIAGAGIATIPLFITPVIMKTAGGVLNRFAGVVNNADRGVFDRAKRRAEDYRNHRKNVRNRNALTGKPVPLGTRGAAKRRAKRNAIRESAARESKRAEQQYIADSSVDEHGKATAFGNRLATGGMFGGEADPEVLQRAIAGAQFTIDQAMAEDIKAQSVSVDRLDLGELKEELKKPDTSVARRAAIANRMIQIGDPDDYAEVVEEFGSDTSVGNSAVRKTIARSLAENNPGYIKASDIDKISRGVFNIKDEIDENGKPILDADGKQVKTTLSKEGLFKSTVVKNVSQGAFSADKMVSASSGAIEYALESSKSAGDSDAIAMLAQAGQEIASNPNLKGRIKHNQKAINEIPGVNLTVRQPTQDQTVEVQTQTQASPPQGGELKIIRDQTSNYTPAAVREEQVRITETQDMRNFDQKTSSGLFVSSNPAPNRTKVTIQSSQPETPPVPQGPAPDYMFEGKITPGSVPKDRAAAYHRYMGGGS